MEGGEEGEEGRRGGGEEGRRGGGEEGMREGGKEGDIHPLRGQHFFQRCYQKREMVPLLVVMSFSFLSRGKRGKRRDRGSEQSEESEEKERNEESEERESRSANDTFEIRKERHTR